MIIQREKNEVQFGNLSAGTVFEWNGRLYMKINNSDARKDSVDLETGNTFDIPTSEKVELVKATLVVG